MRVAALDLGSNSFLLMVSEVVNGELNVLHDESVVTRLAQGVQATKCLHPEALVRAENCFKNFSETIKSYNVDQVVAVSTSAARDAENKQDFFDLGEKYNIPIEIISGDREAELTFLGGTYDLPEKQGRIIVDVGGGSTEIISRLSDNKTKGFSLDIGSVRLTEMFITSQPIKANELDSLTQYIVEQFSSHKNKIPSEASEIVAVAGTPTTLACVIQEKDFDKSIHGYRISKKELQEVQNKLAAMPVDEREALTGMQPGRADVIVAGMAILLEALNYYHQDEMIVSIKGVRYGLAFEAARP